jgi:hypothetical protein
MASPSGCNPNQNQRDGRNTPTLSNKIVKFTFIVTDSRSHFFLEGFHGQYLDAYINDISNVEGHMFNNRS